MKYSIHDALWDYLVCQLHGEAVELILQKWKKNYGLQDEKN